MNTKRVRGTKSSRPTHLLVASTVVVLSMLILMVGTLGWRSISQEAVNETVRMANAGGRLHDDFDGTNKDIYAENYMAANEGGKPIYVRIRLDEYMETGSDAGKNLTASDRKATPVVAGTNVNDKTTWVTHIPEETTPERCTGDSASLHNYWTWTMGGSKIYMPTFNKNSDSLSADVNGTYEGQTAGDAVHYDDYVSYTMGQQVTANAAYDADENDVDEGTSSVLGTNHTEKEETHEAVKTQNAVVMTMKQWKDLGCKTGPYWVYDTDGWAYWAEALQPGEATGLLLDKVELTGDISEDIYYAINVVGQFATADDWGSKDNPVGFYTGYDEAHGITGPTEDALFLLYQAAGKDYQLQIQASGTAGGSAPVEVEVGESITFTSKVTCMGREVTDQSVVWGVKGAASENTKIEKNGTLTVGADETAEVLQVTATYANKITQTVIVEVVHE